MINHFPLAQGLPGVDGSEGPIGPPGPTGDQVINRNGAERKR